jgi:hypothetical protein
LGVHAVSLTNPRNKELDERCMKGKIECRTIADSDLPSLFRERNYCVRPKTKAGVVSLWCEHLSAWLAEWTGWNASLLCCSCPWTVGSDSDAGRQAGVLAWSMWRKLKLIQTAWFSWKPGCLVDHIAASCAVGKAELCVAFGISSFCNSCYRITCLLTDKNKSGKRNKILLPHYLDSETQCFVF